MLLTRYKSDKIGDMEFGGACSTYERGDECVQDFIRRV